MSGSILRFFRKNHGQDVSEYCLITALIALIALGIIWHVSGGVNALWSNSNDSLASANSAAGNRAGGSTTTGVQGGSGDSHNAGSQRTDH